MGLGGTAGQQQEQQRAQQPAKSLAHLGGFITSPQVEAGLWAVALGRCLHDIGLACGGGGGRLQAAIAASVVSEVQKAVLARSGHDGYIMAMPCGCP